MLSNEEEQGWNIFIYWIRYRFKHNWHKSTFYDGDIAAGFCFKQQAWQCATLVLCMHSFIFVVEGFYRLTKFIVWMYLYPEVSISDT